jgi:hypothetical protein
MLHKVQPTAEVVTDAVRRAVLIEAGKLASQFGRKRSNLPFAAWEELAELAKTIATREARRNGFPMNRPKTIAEWATKGFVDARTKILLT